MIFYETFLGSQNLLNNRFKIIKHLRTGTQAKRILQIRDINTKEFFTLYLMDVSAGSQSRIYFFDKASAIVGRRIQHFFFTSSPFYFLKGPNEFGVAVDWCEGSDFYQNAADLTLERFLYEIGKLAEQIAELHNADIFHLDLKEENIIYHNGRPSIIDFGSAMHNYAEQDGKNPCFEEKLINGRILQVVKSFSKFEICSTDMYRPPESIVQLELHDSYSLGQIVYHCLTSYYYDPKKRYFLLEQFSSYFGHEITDLCFGLLNQEEQRYTVREIRRHPVLSGSKQTILQFRLRVQDERRAKIYEYLNCKDSSLQEENSDLSDTDASSYIKDDLFSSARISRRKILTSDLFSESTMSLKAAFTKNSYYLRSATLDSLEQRSEMNTTQTMAQIRHAFWQRTQQRINCLEAGDSDQYSETESQTASSISIFLSEKNKSADLLKTVDFDISDEEQRMCELDCDLSEFQLNQVDFDFSG